MSDLGPGLHGNAHERVNRLRDNVLNAKLPSKPAYNLVRSDELAWYILWVEHLRMVCDETKLLSLIVGDVRNGIEVDDTILAQVDAVRTALAGLEGYERDTGAL